MSLVRYDTDANVAKLNRLPPALRAGFAAACAERLLTGVAPILVRTRSRELETFRAALDKIWRVLEGQVVDMDELEEDRRRCLASLPDEDREPPAPELAQLDDAGAATYYALGAWLTGDTAEAEWAARRAYDMLDHYVTTDLGVTWDGPQGEDAVLGHPVIQVELRRQQRDLEELLALVAGPHDIRAVAKALRERARQEGRDLYGSQPPG